MEGLKDKVALVTGSSRGIGRGIAVCLARDGADVVVNYRTHLQDARETEREIESLGRRAFVVPADMGNRSEQERMFAAAVAHFGHIDIVVANASHETRELVVDARPERVQRTIEVAQLGVFNTCQLAAQLMLQQAQAGRSGGKIVIIGSVQAEFATPASAAYSMSKAAINHLGQTLALELAPYHINVNTINPGWIDTPGEREMFGDAAVDGGAGRVPWGRLGTPQDIGEVAAFLASDAADYVTGASIRVDGGFVVGLRPAGILSGED
jgi:glucose 1-dehydrogenase